MKTADSAAIHVSTDRTIPINGTLAVEAQPTTAPKSSEALPPAGRPILLRDLVPKAVRENKYRAHSFAARLTEQQREILFGWITEYSYDEVCARVAAPAPAGFGLKVHRNTIVRLKRMLDNTDIELTVTNAMDAACDTLDSECAADVAPIRETLSLLLYSRALTYARGSFLPADMDRFLSLLTKVEKLRSFDAPRRHPAPRVKLDVTVSAANKAPGVNSQPKSPDISHVPEVPKTIETPVL